MISIPHHTQRFPKRIVLAAIVTIIALVLSLVSYILQANAAVVGWNAGNIIDDAVFTNRNTMSSSDIQSFLNSKMPNCNNYGEEWARKRYNQTYFTCLKDYTEGGRSAAQIIYDAAQTYSINPQVILVLLQKEQSLITDDSPSYMQYRSATGYGCPDTAACDSTYYGLTNQINWAAKMFRAILNDSPTWYTPYNLGYNFIYYNPNTACGGSSVNIENRATKALYNYTPYQPNQASLDVGWGSVNCGAYGNRNFYLYFTSWFGSTRGPDYAGSIAGATLYYDQDLTKEVVSVNSVYTLEPNQKFYAKITASNTSRATWQRNITKLGTISPNDRSSVFADNGWVNESRHRAAQPSESSDIASGAQATFIFSMTAPSRIDRYDEKFGVVVDGKAWVSGATTTISINVSSNLSDGGRIISKTRLSAGEFLTPGQNIYSAEGHSVLHLSFDGSLELWTNYKKVWSTNTDGSGANKFINQGDGNLVLYKNSSPVWASNTRNEQSGQLALQSDGNLVYYRNQGGVAWASNTQVPDQTNITNSLVLSPGQIVFPGQYLTTPNRYYRLEVQTDGNIVLYTPKRAIWASNTYGHRFDRLIMQGDGNLVAYDGNSHAVWSSNTFMSGASKFVTQQDGNVVMYNSNDVPLWATNTFLVR